MRRRAGERRRLAGLAALLAIAAPASVSAHSPTEREAAREIAAGPLAAELGVVLARPHPGLARLLHVEVDERWHAAAAERRLRAAASWRARWRAAVPGGVIAVTDPAGAPLVGFDAQGRPALTAAPRALDATPRDRASSPDPSS